MKKLTLLLLLSITPFLNLHTGSNPTITNAGSIQIITNIGTPGTINLSGNINIGISPTDIVTLKGAGINNAKVGSNNILVLTSTGNINTAGSNTSIACGTLNANNVNSIGTLKAGDTNCGSLQAATSTGETVILGNDTGTITLISSNIINPIIDNYNLLMIDSNGLVNTANPTTSMTFGDLNTTKITTQGDINCNVLNNNEVNTTGLISCGALTAGKNTGDVITLGNNTGSIILKGSNIISPAVDNFNLITIDSNNNLGSSNSSTLINLGGITTETAIINTDLNSFNIIGNTITATESLICGSLIAATTDGQSIIMGNTMGTISITAANISQPGSGSAPLYINSNGFITTQPSSKLRKENIKRLDISHNTFDNVIPVSFHYKDDTDKKIEYGLIAEDLINNDSLQHAVIYDNTNNPISINYQAIFIALMQDYLQFKNNTKKEINKKNKFIYHLLLNDKENKKQIKKLIHKYKSLKKIIKDLE